MRIVAALFCACVAVPVQAEVHSFYYLGGVYEFANLPSGGNPMFTFGEMTIDDSKLPAGQTLDNLRVDWRFENDEPVKHDYLTLRLYNNLGEFLDVDKGDGWFHQESGSFMQFKDGKPDSWSVRPRYEQASFYGQDGKGKEYDINFASEIAAFDERDGRDVLRRLGYKEGTETFEKLLKSYKWAEGIGSKGVATPAEGEGRWHTDSTTFARRMIKRVQQALSRPPSNFHEIGQCSS